MKLNILCDANWESKLDTVLKDICATKYRSLFDDRDYGSGLIEISIILMARNPELNFKRRIRFLKKVRTLYLDIMLDLEQLRQVDDNGRKRIVINRLEKEIPVVLQKYSIQDFDELRFVKDLKSWLKTVM